MAKTRRQLLAEVAEVLGRNATYRGHRAGKVTYGKYMVYATPAELEKETTTLSNARKVASKLRRLGFKPIIKRHASDGTWSWNETIEDQWTSAVRR